MVTSTTASPDAVEFDDLRSAVSPRAFITDGDVVAGYLRDQAPTADHGIPIGVVRAASTSDVIATVGWCRQHRVPLVPRGAGTGLSGGANAVDGGIVLCLERMDQVVEVNPDTQRITVGAGVVTAHIRHAAAEHGLWYPPDPSSYEWSSIGGNVATNAGGLCCLGYGTTGDYVQAIELVTADATAVRVGRETRKGVAGYDLTSLLVGSEGTLGVFTEITLRLVPIPPPPATIVAAFDDLGASTRAVLRLMSEPTPPTVVELIDRPCLLAVESHLRMDLPVSAAAMLFIQTSSQLIQPSVDLLSDAGGRDVYATGDVEEGALFLGARRAVLPALERLGTVLLDDVAVPVAALGAFVEEVQSIGRRHDVGIATFGHAGDGNLHPTINVPAEDPERSVRAFEDIVDLALALGGTITGEHGVGTLKRSALVDELGAAGIALHRRIKDAFDPTHLFNPGKVLAPW